jgi:hypothetical protein
LDYSLRTFKLDQLLKPSRIIELRDWSELARNPENSFFLGKTFFHFQEIVNYFRHQQENGRTLDNREFSYRKFDVLAIMISFLEGSDADVYVGMNFKPTKTWPETQCAELHALRRAMRCSRRNGHRAIDLMMVSGPPQDDPSGVKSDTLHLCPNCRETSLLLLERGSLLKRDTVVITAHPTMNICEVQILEAMLRLHGNIK